MKGVSRAIARLLGGWAVLFIVALVFLEAGTLNAGSAMAAPGCTGGSITGLGTTLQKIVQQEVWIPAFASEICNKGSHPTVTYNLSPSDIALKEWNYDGERGSINTAQQFIGTDLAPTATQIKEIESAAGGAKVVVIPVAQTAIAVIANPPTGCTIEEIGNKELASVFEGTTYSWSQLFTTIGGAACEAPITRVVPKGTSGVTYQFKNYLYRAHEKGLFCTEGSTEGKATWRELEPQATGGTGPENAEWPEVCAEKALSAVVRPAGTATNEVVKKVNNLAGSISFAPVTDAKSAGATAILLLQNNGFVEPAGGSFADPSVGSIANCISSAYYQVPLGASGGLSIDWSPVFGAAPNAGGTAYPLCMLTYVLAFHGYNAAGFSLEEEQTVHDYLTEYVTQKTGQKGLDSHYYAPLMSSVKETGDVLGAAVKAAEKITP